MLSWSRIVAACKPPQSHVHPADMEQLGVRNICRAAKAYNTLRHGTRLVSRRLAYRHLDVLLTENGPLRTTPAVMTDGWAIDTSLTLPHLEALLDEGARYIAERGMTKRGMAGREFIRDILRQEDLPRFPSFLNFITSSEVLTTVTRYLGFLPVLSTTVPPGIRFVESSADGQPAIGEYQHSQLYHLDLHDRPLVYVIVLLRDVTAKSGPFTFLPAAASARASSAMRYMSRGSAYRVADEQMYRTVDSGAAKVFAYPRGTVLFIDSSQCFHFGSRDAVVTRYQMMYAYVSPCRTDFTESYMKPRVFPTNENDSRLRRSALSPPGR